MKFRKLENWPKNGFSIRFKTRKSDKIMHGKNGKKVTELYNIREKSPRPSERLTPIGITKSQSGAPN